MSDELLIKCGSPTLAGLKTGNMFSYTYESREEVRRDLRRLNKILVPRGLRVIPLRYSDKTVLIYLYRIEALKADLSQKEAVRILREVGYESAEAVSQNSQYKSGLIPAIEGPPRVLGHQRSGLFILIGKDLQRLDDHLSCVHTGGIEDDRVAGPVIDLDFCDKRLIQKIVFQKISLFQRHAASDLRLARSSLISSAAALISSQFSLMVEAVFMTLSHPRFTAAVVCV